LLNIYILFAGGYAGGYVGENTIKSMLRQTCISEVLKHCCLLFFLKTCW